MDKPRGPLTLLMASRRLRLLTAFVVLLPALYVLSFGPVCRTHGAVDCDFQIAVYAPLIRVVNSTGWQWPGEALCRYGGDSGRFIWLVVSIADTIRFESNWDDAALEQDEP